MRQVALAAVACLLAAIVAGSAQQAQQPPLPKFRTDIKLVVVDVSVLDEIRVPVRGLTAADFPFSRTAAHNRATFSDRRPGR
jgi:hypothetical protein